MKLKRVFERREYKYLLSNSDYIAIRKPLMGYMQEDMFGLTTIQSLYFDTADNYFINRSIEHAQYKSKFRIRSYGRPSPTQPVYLEIKKKINGVVYKRRLGIPFNDLDKTINGHTITFADQQLNPNDQQIAREISWFFMKYHITPKVLICDDRVALFANDNPEFRVTFDFNIRFRTEDMALDAGTNGLKINPNFDVVMEVKALGAYPYWFSNIIANLHLVKQRFSKYGYVYEHYLRGIGDKNDSRII